MLVKNMIHQETVSIFEMFGPALGARSQAALLREEILERVKQGLVTRLNFQGVRTVNASFSDELIAKMVQSLGVETFNKMVRISNASDDLKSMINFVVSSRFKKPD